MSAESRNEGDSLLCLCHRQLKSLAAAFRRTGNVMVSDELEDIAWNVEKGRARMDAAYFNEQKAHGDAVRQFTGSLLKAVAAGCITPAKKEE